MLLNYLCSKSNSPDKNGNYLPYIHGETSHIYNTF